MASAEAVNIPPAAPAPAATATPEPSLRSKVMRGSFWTILGFGTSQVLRLGSNLVLAWLLDPAAFGLVALCGVVMQGLQMFSDLGVTQGVIQNKRGEEPEFLNTAWTIQVVRGVVIAALIVLLAWPMARLYDPQLLYLLPAMALVALALGFTSTSMVLLGRRLAVGKRIAIELTSQVLSIAVMISLAWWTRSVWALVIGGITKPVVVALLSHSIVIVTHNHFCWDRNVVRELFDFGKWIFVSSGVMFAANQVDRIVLGLLIPLQLLGVYSLALMLARLPFLVAGELAQRVLFPSLASHIHRDTGKLQAAFQRARRVLLPVSLWVSLGVALGSPLFFELLYDQRYEAATWIGPLLTLWTWFGMLQVLSDRVLLVQGDTRAMATSNFRRFGATICCSLTGYAFAGVGGFIVGSAVGALVGHVTIVLAVRRLGLHVMAQDAAYTLVFLVLGTGCLLTSSAFGPALGLELALGPRLWAAVGILGVVGVWAAWRVRKGLAAR
jgi:O-antigen/teichoic acid export membrane protein